jgi:hypothetical protein
MNQSPFHHALLVLVMVALMLAGGLIQSGRETASGAMATASDVVPVMMVSAVSVAHTSCAQER